MVALSLVALLGAVAISTDYGLLVVDANRLQRGCDAAAIAAANKLDDTTVVTTNHYKATVEAQTIAWQNEKVPVQTTDVTFSSDEHAVTVSSTVTRHFFFGAAIGVPTGQVRRKATARIKPVKSLSTQGPIRVAPIGITLETYNAYKNDQTNSHDISLVRQNKSVFGKDDMVLFDLRDTNAKSGAHMQDQLTGQELQLSSIGDFETTLNAASPSERGKLSSGLDTLFTAASQAPYNDPFALGNMANAIINGTASRLNPRVVYLIVTPSTSAPNNGTFDTQILGFVPVYIEDYEDNGSKGKGSSGDFNITMRFLPPTSASGANLPTSDDPSTSLLGLTSVSLTD